MRATASENGANRFAGWLANAVFAPSATTIVVTNCNGEHDGSLPSALAQAIDGDTVDMSRLTCGTITLQNGELATAAASVTLVGPGADRLAISGAGNHRVIDHAGTGTLHVQGLTLRDGAGVGNGGCIRSAGNVDLEKSVVTACHASDNTLGGGGGIFASGDLVMNESRLTDNVASNSDNTSYGGGALIRGAATITRSTISGNSAQYSGGGLMIYHAVDIEESTISGNRVSAPYSQGGGLTMLNFPGDDKRLAYDTFSGNSATQAGGAIEAYGPFSILASTIASNAAARGGGLDSGAAMAVFTTIVSGNASLPGSTDIGGSGTVIGNHDLVGTSMPALPGGTLRSDPLLGPLAGNGGPTLTHSLLSGSPAIDAIRETAADSPTTGFGNRGNAVDLIDRTTINAATGRHVAWALASTSGHTKCSPPASRAPSAAARRAVRAACATCWVRH